VSDKKLGKKNTLTNEQWLEAVANIKNLVSLDELKKLEKKTIADIKAAVKGKKAAYAWSGGKDSLVLAALCEKAKVADCVLGRCNLEFQPFMEWIDENKPAGLEIINTGLDMEWLVKNQNLIFPDAAGLAAWCQAIHLKAQTQYYRKHNLDALILGRRKADGNFVGRGSNIYTNGKGVTNFSPIADWSHEMVLAYIAYYEIPLPPIYDWINGYKRGTHAWPMRPGCKTKEEGWREIHAIDPALVEGAAEHIPAAKQFLEGVA
jgi:3'-phosphoadenosine 5'-phosphosulfate sulfotransferase (PAPS reductase)/FAD synthetase